MNPLKEKLVLWQELKEHQTWVNCITRLNGEAFASCSNDGEIKVWDLKNASASC
jgi:WD40 repeat protein